MSRNTSFQDHMLTICAGYHRSCKKCVGYILQTLGETLKLFEAGGSADPGKNVHLATIVKKYKDGGVPRENLEKALAKVGHRMLYGISLDLNHCRTGQLEGERRWWRKRHV